MSSPLSLQRAQLDQMLIAHPIFSGLREGELDALVDAAELRQLAVGEALFLQGAPGTDIFVVLSGQFRITCASPDGVEVVVGVIDNDGLIGEMSALDSEPRSATATAAVDSTVVQIPNILFRELVRQGHPAARGILRLVRHHVCHRMRMLDERIDAVFLPAAEPERTAGLTRDRDVGEHR
ncbi:MAG: cyclic nucleotide-binding domain-containing protein [Myxococcota bacterium]|nr:cyclic nucleotide-binding domain-containing protein [Myxococcota bacterium]